MLDGYKTLKEIFFRNAVGEVEEQVRNTYNNPKHQELSVAHCSKLPFELHRVLEHRVRMVEEVIDLR